MEGKNVVSDFYNKGGWRVNDDGDTADAELYEDLRSVAASYVSRCRRRLLRFIPRKGERILDMASGPIQYPEYLEYSENYRYRYCVDFSSEALSAAEEKIGDHGRFFVGDFLEMDFQEDFFDCAISLHTIYHIPCELQSLAVERLISTVKPGCPVIIIYGNPWSLEQLLLFGPNRIVRNLFNGRLGRSLGQVKSGHAEVKSGDLYYHVNKLSWWRQFSSTCDISIFPWRTFGATVQKIFFPANSLGAFMFRVLFRLEDLLPFCFKHIAAYPMIVLVKR